MNVETWRESITTNTFEQFIGFKKELWIYGFGSKSVRGGHVSRDMSAIANDIVNRIKQ